MSDITNPPRRGRRPLSPNQILYTRRHAAELLDTSVDVIKELEERGVLDQVRLTGPRGGVHLRAEQVHALAHGGDVSTAAPASTVPFRRSSK